MSRLLTTSLALALLALPSTSAMSQGRGKTLPRPALRTMVASALVPATALAMATPRPSSSREPRLIKHDVANQFNNNEPVTIVPVLLHDANSKENQIFLLTLAGEVIGDDSSTVDRFFRCRRSQRRHRMAPEILAVLADISAAYPGHVIEVVSGYRKRGFGVKGSKHFSGHAIDLRVRGVKTTDLRDFLWAGKKTARGVGHYRHENFVHVDYRPHEAKVGWTQRRRNSAYQFNPKWAHTDAPTQLAAH